MIAEALGRPLVASASAVTARIEVVAGPAIDGRIELLGADGVVLGTRTIETSDPTCRTLADGLPLVVAMLVDLHRRDAVLHVPLVRDAPPDAPPLELVLDVGLAIDAGWLPDVAWMPFAELLIGPEPLFRVMVRVSVVAPQHATRVAGDLTPGVDVWGAVGALGACVLPRVGDVDLGGCGAVEGGWLDVAGTGLLTRNRSDAAHAALEVLGLALFRAGPLVLGVEAGVAIGLTVQRFVYSAGGEFELFRSSPVTFRAALSVGIR